MDPLTGQPQRIFIWIFLYLCIDTVTEQYAASSHLLGSIAVMRNSVEGTCRLRGGFDNPNPIYHHGTTDDESEKEQNADALDEKKILESVLKHVRPKPAPPPEKPKEKTE